MVYLKIKVSGTCRENQGKYLGPVLAGTKLSGSDQASKGKAALSQWNLCRRVIGFPDYWTNLKTKSAWALNASISTQGGEYIAESSSREVNKIPQGVIRTLKNIFFLGTGRE